MSNLSSLTSAQLIKAAAIKDKIEALNEELASLLGSSSAAQTSAKPAKKGMSAAGRKRVAAAQRARWKKIKAAKSSLKPAKKKRKMSAEGRARIIAAQKARWQKIKAAKKA